jgi:hypothetical protein
MRDAQDADSAGNYRRPTSFISYAWDSDVHKEWVHSLATKLRKDGVDVRLDQWDVVPGDQLPHFMETAVRENDFVIIVCTEKYKRKSDERQGGSGYEGSVMTGEVYVTQNHRKFIPLCRSDGWSSCAPSWLLSKVYIDFSGDPYPERSYQTLLDALYQRRPPRPKLGEGPSAELRPASNDARPVDPVSPNAKSNRLRASILLLPVVIAIGVISISLWGPHKTAQSATNIAVAKRYNASDPRIFGSIARGDAGAGSDVDFLVRFEPGRSLFDQAGCSWTCGNCSASM